MESYLTALMTLCLTAGLSGILLTEKKRSLSAFFRFVVFLVAAALFLFPLRNAGRALKDFLTDFSFSEPVSTRPGSLLYLENGVREMIANRFSLPESDFSVFLSETENVISSIRIVFDSPRPDWLGKDIVSFLHAEFGEGITVTVEGVLR